MSQTGLETVYLKVETSFQSDGNNINVQKNNIGRPYVLSFTSHNKVTVSNKG